MTDPTGPASPEEAGAGDAHVPPAPPAPEPAAPASAPRFVQPYPGAPPVPVDAEQARGPYAAPPPGYPGAPGRTPTPPSPPAGHTAPPPPGPAGPPPPRPADTRPKTLAILALSLAGGGALIALIPFLGVLAVPLFVAASVIAIIALVRRSQGGTGFSIAALAISGLAAVMALFLGVSVLLLALAENWANRDDRSWVEEEREPDPYDDEDPYAGDGAFGAEQDLRLVESAFGTDAAGETWWAIVVENPNDDAVFDFGEIAVTALDAQAETLEVAYEYLGILPGTTAVVGTFAEATAAGITALGVELPGRDTAWVSGQDALGSLTVEDVTTTVTSEGTTVAGVVRSTMTESAEYPLVSLVARDASGAVIDVAVGFADAVPAGGEGSFDAVFTPTLPEGTTIEAYPAL
ncbi:hypothetical protein [Microbacterium sp. GXF7504]